MLHPQLTHDYEHTVAALEERRRHALAVSRLRQSRASERRAPGHHRARPGRFRRSVAAMLERLPRRHTRPAGGWIQHRT